MYVKAGVKLYIDEGDGTLHEVTELGGYNMKKPMAQADVITDIQYALDTYELLTNEEPADEEEN